MPRSITVKITIERAGGGGFLRSAGRAVDVACSLIISRKVSRPFSVLSPPSDEVDFTSKYVKACILANT